MASGMSGYPGLPQWMQQGGGRFGGQQPAWAMAQPYGQQGGGGASWNMGGVEGGGSAQPVSQPGRQAAWGEASPGHNYTWADLSYPSDPQWLGGYLRDYANKLGYFGDPRQSAMFDFSRQQAAQNSGAMQRRAQMAAQVSGLPQGQRGYAWLQGMLGGQGNEAMINNQLLQQQFQQQQDWARQLAAQFSGNPDTRAQTNALRQQTNMAWMGPLGQIGGAALGALRPYGG